MTSVSRIEPADGAAPGSRKQLDLEGLRARLAGQEGKAYWRSLDELAGTEEFRQLLEREFPESASEWEDGVSRRTFLKLMGASLAFGGLTGCTVQPEEKIVPWVRAPENMLPGRPLMYATAASLAGVGVGVLAETHMGRPTLLEGNAEHPSGTGGIHPTVQASILGLYDPDRSQTVKNAGRISTWGRFVEALSGELESQRSKKGRGLRILTGAVTSPTLGAQLRDLLAQMPEARWHQYDPGRGDGVFAGARQAFGKALHTHYDISRAEVILCLDADIFFQGAASARHASDFMRQRAAGLHAGETSVSNRLYVVESSPSPTGSVADHRLPLDRGSMEAFAAALAARLGIEARYEAGRPAFEDEAGWVEAVAADLKAHRGAGLVVAGPEQSAALHALVHAINHALGNAGRTVHHTDPIDVEAVDHFPSLSELTRQMRADEVESLVILGVNPVYDAPGDLDFASALETVPFRAHLGSHEDETAYLCHWHVPESHFLEAWSDVRTSDGTVSIVQPLIKPLYPSRSAHEVVAAMTGRSGKPVRDLVREHWAKSPLFEGRDFEKEWQKALHDGSIEGSALPRREVSPRGGLRLPGDFGRGLDPEEGLELSLRADPFLGTGAHANNGWLQETPRPITLLTWDNAALLSPATAQRLGVGNEQVLTITVDGRSLSVPAWIVPGQAPGVVTVHLGGGAPAGGPDRRRYRLRRRTPADHGLALVDDEGGDRQDLRPPLPRLHPGPPGHGGPVLRSPGRPRSLPAAAALRPRGLRPRGPRGSHPLRRVRLQGAQPVGDGHRPDGVHGLQRLHRGLPGREQHPRRRQGRGSHGPGDVLDPRRPLLHRPRRPGDPAPAGPLPAVRERPLRGRLPGDRHLPQRGRPERHGLQPLRGDPLLRQQLPVQGPPLQLSPVRRPRDRDPQDGAEPRRDRAGPRRDGEVHLLRAADQRGPGGGQEGERRGPGRRRRREDGLPAGLPHGSDHLRQSHRRRERGEPPQALPPSTTASSPSSTPGRAPPTWPGCGTPNPGIG